MRSLGEWDGEKWAAHDLLSDGFARSWTRRLMGVDGTGRLWLVDAGVDRQTVLLYGPAGDRWGR